MSRWIPEECGKIVDETGAFLGRANSDDDAKNLCSDHNADCDTYEARIRELEAKLARVLDGLKPKGDCPIQVNSHSWYQWVGWYDAHARAVAIAEDK